MIKTKQELCNYLGQVMKDLYKELDLTPFTQEQCEVLHFCDELYEKWEELHNIVINERSNNNGN